MEVKIKLIDNGKTPVFKHDGDACADCFSNEDITVKYGARVLVNLGFAIELPAGYEAVIRPRSGLASKGIVGEIGTVDSNYRGEVKANLVNTTFENFEIKKGDRICQLAIRRTEPVNFVEVDELSESERGNKGFGSSGL